MLDVSQGNPIKLAVITGRHPYDVLGLQDLFRSLPGLNCYIQHLEAYATSASSARSQYDAVLFYNMHKETPSKKDPWYELGTREAIEQLGETPQGIIVMHHAIVAYPDWHLWDEITGVKNRRTRVDSIGQMLRVHVANSQHPITRGLTDWEMEDEAYDMPDAADGCDILLTTDHPKSMKTLAWTHQHKQSRVFNLQSGHDAITFSNAHYRQALTQGIQWCAGRI